MRKSIKHIIPAAAAALLLGSCDKSWLAPTPL